MIFKKGDKVAIKPELRNTNHYRRYDKRHFVFTVSRSDSSDTWFKEVSGFLQTRDLYLVRRHRPIIDIINS